MFSFNHSVLGFYYLLFSIFGSILGFSFSLVLSLELNSPFTVFGEFFYYVSLTSHGVIMVFYFLTLLGTSFFYLLVPGLCFVKDFYFPSLSFLSFVLSFSSLLILVFSLVLGEFVNTGWTFYVPLSSSVFSDSLCLDLAILSLLMFSFSSVVNSFNLICTVVFSFFHFESLLDVPVLVWSGFLTSFLILFSVPSLVCVLFMLLFDSNLCTFYFDCEFGGSPILFQSLFWFWGHPEVYVLILPVFGIISHCVFVVCKSFLYNSSGIIFSMFSLSVLSFLVWGHHMVTSGLDLDVKGFFMVSTMVISIPTGVKVFSWVYSMFICGGEFCLLSGLIIIFIFTFSLGGVTGVFLSNYSLDVVFHDSYFVVGHFHTVLAVSSLFGYSSGLVLLLGSSFISSFFYSFSFLLSLVFVSLSQLLFSFHVKGLLGLPSSVSNYSLDYFFLFYLGGIGVLGFWFSLCLLLVLFLKGLGFFSYSCLDLDYFVFGLLVSSYYSNSFLWVPNNLVCFWSCSLSFYYFTNEKVSSSQ